MARRDKRISHLLSQIMPEDLLKFGMIPEFIGRVPIVATFDQLGEEDLVRILTTPKNALTKQFQRLLRMEGVELEVTPPALQAIARKAIRQNTGARGLRRIFEEMMLDLMYDIPSSNDVSKVIITERTVERKEPYQVLYKMSEEQTA